MSDAMRLCGRLSRPILRLRKLCRRFRRNTVGSIAAIVALTSPVIIGAMGLGGEAASTGPGSHELLG